MRGMIVTCVICSTLGIAEAQTNETSKPRLIVMADMGNEPDEEQQMAHLLMYANRIDIEGLIACSGKYMHADRKDGRTKTRPDLFHRMIDGYAKVVDKLEQHEEGWPSADELRRRVSAGTAGYGMDAVKAGAGNIASRQIEAAILKKDSRKLYIVCNAGANTLAQALVDLDQRFDDDTMDDLCQRIIVFENGAQDNAGASIAGRYPRIAWHRSNFQTYAYGGPRGQPGPYTWPPYENSVDGQNDWAREHIMKGHGELGARYPPRRMGKRLHFIEGGGTIPWMGLVNHGLTDPENLQWGGWSGRFSRTRHSNIYSRHADIRSDEKAYPEFRMFEADSEVDEWTDPATGHAFQNQFVPVWRFRRAMFRDFQARMDWCVEDFENANHPPIAVVNKDDSNQILHVDVSAGEEVKFDAASSRDPDEDALHFRWWIYQEAGTYPSAIELNAAETPLVSLNVPANSAGAEIHLILTVEDQNPIVPLTDYRRIVLSVR